jgi:hypothetical protein
MIFASSGSAVSEDDARRELNDLARESMSRALIVNWSRSASAVEREDDVWFERDWRADRMLSVIDS